LWGGLLSTNFEFELCAETVTSCAAALRGGASRIELCRALNLGGLTPDASTIRLAVKQSGVPVHVLLRPSPEHFRFSSKIFQEIVCSMDQARELGAAGFVLGLLRFDGTVDVEHTRKLVERASPLPVTFHRAFDQTPDLEAALESVIRTGCKRILTSGGEANVLAGVATLGRLHRQAGDRIEIMAGGGLRLENARKVATLSRVRHFHSSLGELEGDSDTRLPPWLRIRQLVDALAEPSTGRMGEAPDHENDCRA
jgi:copper homeostasis protein